MQIGTDMVAAAGPRREPIDRVLGAIGAVLLIAVLAAAAFLAYSVVQGRSIELGATPSARLIDDLHAQIEASQNDPALRVRLGVAYAASGNFGKAVEELNVALELDPEHTGAQLVRGMVAMMEKDYVKAEAAFKRAMEIQPDWPPPHRNLASLYLAQGKTKEAMAKYEAALKANPDDFALYLFLAQLYELATRYGPIPYFWIDMKNWASANLTTQEIYDALKNINPRAVVLFNQHIQDGRGIKYFPTDVLDGEMHLPPPVDQRSLRSGPSLRAPGGSRRRLEDRTERPHHRVKLLGHLRYRYGP